MYLWIKAFHIFSVISWSVGLLYLPRLYVYHADVTNSSQKDIFLTMEKRLIKIIMTPAMISSFLFGLWMLVLNPSILGSKWFMIKLFLILLLVFLHIKYVKMMKSFASGNNIKSPRYYRIWNEVPAVIMLMIVILAVVKPF